MGRPAARLYPRRPRRARRARHPPARARRGPGPGHGVRRVPHRSAPAPRATCCRTGRRRCPATRSSAWSTRLGAGAPRFALGERVGIAWLRHTCGTCRFCRRGDENLCLEPRFTGWDADGGYAEFAVATSASPTGCPTPSRRRGGTAAVRRHHRLPCAAPGRAARRAAGSASTASAPRRTSRPRWRWRKGATVHVMTRSPRPASSPSRSGRASAGDTFDRPPEPLDSAIVFAPAGEIVPAALEALDRGGTLAIAGIHLTDIPTLALPRSPLPGAAGAQRHGQHPARRRGVPRPRRSHRDPGAQTVPYPVEAGRRALRDLAHDRITGAAVLDIRP